jgi:hypothetical protein
MRLLEKYRAATSALFAATTRLQLTTGVGFPEALAASKAAGAKCAKARRALLNHRDLHSF